MLAGIAVRGGPGQMYPQWLRSNEERAVRVDLPALLCICTFSVDFPPHTPFLPFFYVDRSGFCFPRKQPGRQLMPEAQCAVQGLDASGQR